MNKDETFMRFKTWIVKSIESVSQNSDHETVNQVVNVSPYLVHTVFQCTPQYKHMCSHLTLARTDHCSDTDYYSHHMEDHYS